MIPLPDLRDEIREWLIGVVRMARAPTGPNGDAPLTNEELVDYAMTSDAVSRLLSAPEPAELDEVGVEEAAIALMEMVGGPGVPDHFAARTAIEAYLRVANAPAPTAAEPEAFKTLTAESSFGSRAGQWWSSPGVEGEVAIEIRKLSSPSGVFGGNLTSQPAADPVPPIANIGGSGSGKVPAAEPEREAPTPETERLFEAVLYGVRCGRGAVNDAACESIAREVIAALTTPEAEGGPT